MRLSILGVAGLLAHAVTAASSEIPPRSLAQHQSLLSHSAGAGADADADASTHPGCRSGRHVVRGLRPRLSKEAAIVLPSSAEGESLLIRASSPRICPNYVAIVEVATEADVQQTIKYANSQKMPFLAVSGGHGWPTTLNGLQCGIQINMRRLNHTELNVDGKTANVGGGAMQHEITTALFKKNKQAVTGICECTSGIGPLLGGGHSMLQGRHGFAADNLVAARVALADGRIVTASAKENPDLFWALRGAGHNFGVVTSYDLKVYDVEDDWTMVAFSFTQDKLEKFFAVWNKIEQKYEDPGLVLLNGVINRNDDLDAKHPVINLQVIYEGSNNIPGQGYASAFRKLGPVVDETTNNIMWGDLFDVGGFGLSSPVCRKNQNILGYPNSFPKWIPKNMRAAFNVFSELTSDKTFATSAFMLESYGSVGVQAIPESENAVAPEERQNRILTSPILWWKGDSKRNRDKAVNYGKKIQQAVRDSRSPAHSYVNYAAGGEPQAEVYGRSAERLAKLKNLKRKWDPQNRFNLYNPIH